MAKKVIIENTGEAAVYLPVDAANQETLIVPRAVKEKIEDKGSGEARFVSRPSRVEVDEDVLARLQKSKVVAAYFSTGRLRVVGSGPPPAPDSSKREGK